MKDVLEGEVVNSNRNLSNNYYEFQNLKFPFWKLLICIIPIGGFLYSIYWFYISRKNNPFELVFSILGIVLSTFSTVTFLTLKFILKSIF
jgi:hypothetical protein